MTAKYVFLSICVICFAIVAIVIVTSVQRTAIETERAKHGIQPAPTVYEAPQKRGFNLNFGGK
jgi:hypothetical protein